MSDFLKEQIMNVFIFLLKSFSFFVSFLSLARGGLASLFLKQVLPGPGNPVCIFSSGRGLPSPITLATVSSYICCGSPGYRCPWQGTCPLCPLVFSELLVFQENVLCQTSAVLPRPLLCPVPCGVLSPLWYPVPCGVLSSLWCPVPLCVLSLLWCHPLCGVLSPVVSFPLCGVLTLLYPVPSTDRAPLPLWATSQPSA